MQITPTQLESSGYTLLDRLEHEQMTTFIQQYVKKRNWYGWGYYALTAIFMAGIAATAVYSYQRQLLSIERMSTAFFWSFLVAFALVPLHEFIHVLAYKKLGAINTSYDVLWRKLMFLAVADQFVASRREFIVVALAPCVTISVLLLALLPFVSPFYFYLITCVLFWHFSFCAGDFGLLSYFAYHADKEVVTYDDKANRISYFYAKITSPVVS